jgi:hypothetical protein
MANKRWISLIVGSKDVRKRRNWKCSMTETQAPSNDKPWLQPWVAILAIPVLLGLSALLAQFVTFRHSTLSIPFAVAVLIRDAIPWLIQFAAIALLLVSLNRAFIHATRPQVKAGLGYPLGVGLIYWIWTIAKLLPNATALDAINGRILEDLGRQLGGAPRLQDILYRFNSLLVAPLNSQGWIIHMQEWGFVLCGLSTLLATAYWLYAAKWIGFTDKTLWIPHARQWFRILLAMLAYFLPVFIDSAFYLLRLAREMQR